MTDAVPAPIRSLATLFSEALPRVAFPDVDAAALAASVAKVDAAQSEVTRLEEELAKARAHLDASRDDLVRLATRAHAYARVYAEDDDTLRARIDEIAIPRAKSKSNAPKVVVTEAPAASETLTPAPVKKKRKGAQEDDASLFAPGDDVRAA
jgi:hypothetical protein